MLTLALDPSSTACGWALFDGQTLEAHGTVRRHKWPLHAYACEVDAITGEAIASLFSEDDVRVVYELSNRPIPAVRLKGMVKAFMATGRILQAMRVDGEPVRPDNKKKGERRADMVLKYEIETRLSEHAADAIMLGDRVVNDPAGDS